MGKLNSNEKIPITEFILDSVTGEKIPETWSQKDVDFYKKQLTEEEKKSNKVEDKILLLQNLISEIEGKIDQPKTEINGFILSDKIIYKEKQKLNNKKEPMYLKKFYFNFFKRMDIVALRSS